MSSRILPNTKQKQPRGPYQIHYAPVKLPAPFPVKISGLFAQGDAPIKQLHVHDCLELGYCYEGAGVFVVGEKVMPFREGDISFISAGEVHLARSVSGTQSKWIWVYLDPVRLLETSHPGAAVLRTAQLTGRQFCNIITQRMDALAGIVLRELVEELQKKPAGYQSVAIGLVWTLMARVHRLNPKPQEESSQTSNTALQKIAPALDLMAARHAEPVPLEEWARSCHMSPTHFTRLFRQALGRSPYSYLIELRVRMAATQLHATREKIVVIAQEVGFVTLSSFNRAFRHVMGVTPREWREWR